MIIKKKIIFYYNGEKLKFTEGSYFECNNCKSIIYKYNTMKSDKPFISNGDICFECGEGVLLNNLITEEVKKILKYNKI